MKLNRTHPLNREHETDQVNKPRKINLYKNPIAGNYTSLFYITHSIPFDPLSQYIEHHTTDALNNTPICTQA